jgi:hypothetical protein
MKVTLIGFHLEFPKSELITPEQFYESLCSADANINGNHILAACQRLHNEKSWLAGVLISDKDAKNIAVKIRHEKKFTVKPHSLGKDTTVTDFNFFVYYAKTCRGVFQSYYRSTTVNQFLDLLDIFYRKLKTVQVQKRQEAGALPDREFLKLRKDANRHLIGRVIVKRDELPKLVEQLDRIKSIEIEFSSYTPEQAGDLTGLSSHAKHHVHRLTYAQDAGKIIKGKVADFFSNIKHVEKIVKKAKVSGMTPGGLEQHYSLANNPDKLGEADYDEWIQEVDLDSSAWGKCLQTAGILTKLLHVTEEKRVKAVLMTPTA